MAITVDDCDRPEAWRGILDVLGAYDAKATFFALGVRVIEHPGLALCTIGEGHAVGSHGWDHARLTELTPDATRWRLDQDHRTWMALAGVTPRPYFRPPYGAYDGDTLGTARSAGYGRTVLWDVDPEDWTEPGAEWVARRVTARVAPGSIVALHAVEQTAEALGPILTALARKGLTPVTVPELFALAGL